MAMNLGRVDIYNDTFLQKVTRYFDHVILQGHVNYYH